MKGIKTVENGREMWSWRERVKGLQEGWREREGGGLDCQGTGLG